jgi:RNA polymerase sigma-70 factor (ECF subfamily)
MSSIPVPSLETELSSLYQRHSRRILGFCLRRLPSREEAEDAVQQTFLNAYRGLQRGTTPRCEAAWLFKIAENVCRERRRAAWRRRRVETVHDPEGIARAAAPESEHDELAGLADALSELAPNQQRAILLREWQGLSYREIAAELGVTQAAVETLLFRARRSLAYKLDRTRARALGSLGSAAAWGQSLLGSIGAKVAATAGVFVAVTALTPALRQEIGGAFASTPRASVPAATEIAPRPAQDSHPARARHQRALRAHPARRAKATPTGLRVRATSHGGRTVVPADPPPPPGHQPPPPPPPVIALPPLPPVPPVNLPSLPSLPPVGVPQLPKLP